VYFDLHGTKHLYVLLCSQRYQKHAPPVINISNNGYEEIIIFGEEVRYFFVIYWNRCHCYYWYTQEGVSEPKYYNTFTPKHGIRAPKVDYHRYNSVRKSAKDKVQYYKYTCILDFMLQKANSWEFDRNKLVYMRELGEGQFGKVLLMKAKVVYMHHKYFFKVVILHTCKNNIYYRINQKFHFIII